MATGSRFLRHRGPDDSGVETMGPACFSHARLSIIDPDRGHQPMLSRDGRGMLTYNGEVYNFRDLRVRLEGQGHRFETASDSEVVLAAYRAWGEACVEAFRGMFAFAAYDGRRKKALLARDRVGKKPLFYTVRDRTLYFSSELEPLYRTVGPFKLDEEALDEYLSWQYVPAPRTIYRDVHCLQPAHRLSADLETGDLTTDCYWRLRFAEDRSLDAKAWEKALDEKLREAVHLRLVSDVPFGAFLSGGIDSSLVVSYMAECLETPVQAFSIGFREAAYDELEYAKIAAAVSGADHHTEIVEVDSLALLPTLVRHFGQPFADSSAIPTYLVSRMAGAHVKMVLSGDGGDENFAGYNTYGAIMAAEGHGGAPAQAGIGRRVLRRVMAAGRKAAGRYSGSGPVVDAYLHAYQHFSEPARRALYRGRLTGLARDRCDGRRIILSDGDTPLLARLQHLDILTYLPFDILTKVDVASMANSLEVRSPLLDHELMEMAATIPGELKFSGSTGNTDDGEPEKKVILRRLARNRFPERMIERPKWGFGIPLGDWFSGPLKSEVERRLLGSDFLGAFFDSAEIRRLLKAHSPARDHSPRLWNLLFLEEWMRSHSEALG